MNVPDAIPLLARLRGEIGNALLGAGTVLDAATARACIEAGAQFIVAPGFDPEVLDVAHAADKPCIPGALTPTEVIAAWCAGADMVEDLSVLGSGRSQLPAATAGTAAKR